MTVYFYIEQTEELISLHSTEDILEVPVDARIVSEEDAAEIFPAIPNGTEELDVLTVRHPEYAGTYVHAHRQADRGRMLDRSVLIRTDAIKKRALSAVANGKCRFGRIDSNARHLEPFSNLYVPSLGSTFQSITSSSSYMFDSRALLAKDKDISLNNQYPYMDYGSYNSLSDIIGPTDIDTARSMLAAGFNWINNSNLDIPTLSDDLLTQIINSIAAFDKSTFVVPEDRYSDKVLTYKTFDIKCTDGSTLHIRMDYMFQGYFNIFMQKFPDPVLYVKKGIARYKRQKKTIRLPTERIIYPETHVLSISEMVLSPVDTTKRARRRFLAKLYQLGWYSMRTQIKKELESMFAARNNSNVAPVVDKKDLLEEIQNFSTNVWIKQEVKDAALANILASPEANKLIDNAIKSESKLQALVTKSAVRKALFKDIRKRLDMQK